MHTLLTPLIWNNPAGAIAGVPKPLAVKMLFHGCTAPDGGVPSWAALSGLSAALV